MCVLGLLSCVSLVNWRCFHNRGAVLKLESGRSVLIGRGVCIQTFNNYSRFKSFDNFRGNRGDCCVIGFSHDCI